MTTPESFQETPMQGISPKPVRQLGRALIVLGLACALGFDFYPAGRIDSLFGLMIWLTPIGVGVVGWARCQEGLDPEAMPFW